MKNQQGALKWVVLFVMVLAAGCSLFPEKTVTEDKGTSAGQPYSSSRGKMKIAVPAGWTIQEIYNKTSDKLRFATPPTGGGAVLQIERFTESAGLPDGAVSWLVFKAIKDGTSPNAKLEFLNEGPSKFRGLGVYAADLKNSTMTGKIICFYKSGHQYTLTYFIARSLHSNEMNAAIKLALSTLEFL